MPSILLSRAFYAIGGLRGRHAAIGHASAFFPSLQILLMRRQDNRIVQYLSLSLSTRKAASLLKEEGKEKEDKKRKDSSLRSEPGQKPGLAHFLQRSHGMVGVYFTAEGTGASTEGKRGEGRGATTSSHRSPFLNRPFLCPAFPRLSFSIQRARTTVERSQIAQILR